MASAAVIMEATPAFMLRMPPPKIRLPSTEGVQGSRLQPMARGSMSMWPLNMSDLPPPGASESGDGLEPAGVYFLEFDLVAAGAEEFGEKACEVGFFRLEAGDSDHILGQVQHGSWCQRRSGGFGHRL